MVIMTILSEKSSVRILIFVVVVLVVVILDLMVVVYQVRLLCPLHKTPVVCLSQKLCIVYAMFRLHDIRLVTRYSKKSFRNSWLRHDSSVVRPTVLTEIMHYRRQTCRNIHYLHTNRKKRKTKLITYSVQEPDYLGC